MRPQSIVAILLASVTLAIAQTSGTATTISTTVSHTASVHPTIVSSSTVSAPVPSETRESSEYYPTDDGQSYDTQPGDVGYHSNDSDGGGVGKSDAFMGAGIGAQIGVIVGVIVVAIILFVGIVVYYFRRKKQWEREVKRRSALPMNAKIIVTKKGEVKLAERSSTSSQVGLEELEKGGHKVGNLEGERKPGIFKMLLGKF